MTYQHVPVGLFKLVMGDASSEVHPEFGAIWTKDTYLPSGKVIRVFVFEHESPQEEKLTTVL